MRALRIPAYAESEPANGDYLARVAAVSPLLEEVAGEIDKAGDLPSRLVDALHGQEMYRMLLPSDLGGGQLDPRIFVEVMEAIARIDASTAWCVGQTASCSMSAAAMDPAAAREVFGEDRSVLAWGPGRGRADIVDGAYVLTGEWNFGSGSHQATWLGGMAMIFENGKQLLEPSGKPVTRTLIFPAKEATFKPLWDVIGLRGTGSDGYSVENLRVPLTHSIVQDSIDERRNRAALYAYTSRNIYATGFAGIALGVATSMLDIFIDIARNKVPKGQTATLKSSTSIQAQVAECTAIVESCRHYLRNTVDRVWQDLCASGADSMPMGDRVALRLAASHTIRQCAKVGEFAFHAAGATAIFSGNPIERRYRDMIALRQHMQGRDDLFELCGQYLLGDTPEFVLV